MERPPRRPVRRALTAASIAMALALGAGGAIALRRCAPARPSAASAEAAPVAAGPRDREPAPLAPAPPPTAREDLLVPSPSAGWEEAAADVAADLRRLLDGRATAGAYAEARAEAARRDLALFPPETERLARLLRGSERERIVALAALAAHPAPDDDLVAAALRAQRPEDDDVVRLLGAELASALPPDVLARHEDDLLRAFAGEPNPLVLAVALPALERMEMPRLRALLRAQLAAADPEMLPVLLALARARVAPSALDELDELAAGLAEPVHVPR